jgi:hypothetical protein
MQPCIAAEEESLPEEITVEASRDRINFKLQVDQAENQFYALFNELIDDEDFRIECKYETVIGSLIKQRICQTKYMRDELSTAATLSLSGANYMISSILTEKNRELREKTMDLLENNPEFRSAAQNLSERVEEYQDEYGIEANKE